MPATPAHPSVRRRPTVSVAGRRIVSSGDRVWPSVRRGVTVSVAGRRIGPLASAVSRRGGSGLGDQGRGRA